MIYYIYRDPKDLIFFNFERMIIMGKMTEFFENKNNTILKNIFKDGFFDDMDENHKTTDFVVMYTNEFGIKRVYMIKEEYNPYCLAPFYLENGKIRLDRWSMNVEMNIKEGDSIEEIVKDFNNTYQDQHLEIIRA